MQAERPITDPPTDLVNLYIRFVLSTWLIKIKPNNGMDLHNFWMSTFKIGVPFSNFLFRFRVFTILSPIMFVNAKLNFDNKNFPWHSIFKYKSCMSHGASSYLLQLHA